MINNAYVTCFGITEYAHYTHTDFEMVHKMMEEVAKHIGRKLPYKKD